MRILIIIAITFSTTFLYAQKIVIWIGGTPGSETSWDQPKNWSNHNVPNEFSNVLIPDVSNSTFSNPVIQNGIIELKSLQIESSAKLTIDKMAKLIVYGKAEGIYASNVEIKGSLIVWDEVSDKEVDIKVALLNSYTSPYSKY
ncbi:MAG: hypothetical protein AB8F94_29565 [Saprospiraceae bacterium]